jgi:hypothetical protein
MAILSLFEVVLRNKIDSHYKLLFPSSPNRAEWLLASIQPGGFLTRPGCENSLRVVRRTHDQLGVNYSHDKLLAALSFGFWKFLFAGRQFSAGGDSLLAIFPNLPFHHSQVNVYHKLDQINSLRNRVAHHEPICFGQHNTISTIYARSHYLNITEIVAWMNINHGKLFFGIGSIHRELSFIDRIRT